MTNWTTHELKRLREAYHSMTRQELAVEFPKHPARSVIITAYNLGLRRVYGRNNKWLNICALHKSMVFPQYPWGDHP